MSSSSPFLLLLFVLLSQRTVRGSINFAQSPLHASCLHARPLSTPDSFCDFVSWNSANLFTTANYTLYNPGRPISDKDQGQYSKYLFNNYQQKANNPNSACVGAIKRLACVEGFPSCPMSGQTIGSVAYFPPCNIQCQQVNAACGSSLQLNCNTFPQTNCNVFVPSGFLLLPQSQGPYGPLQYIYIFVLIAWVIMAITWNVLTFSVYKDRCVVLCRAVSGIPVIKVLVTIFALAFWATCDAWQMCSFWIGVSLTNTHLVYETGEMMIFILVAKGWSITRDSFFPSEWRTIIMIMSGFYMANSILLVLETTVLTRTQFWIAIAVLYGLMYIFILLNTVENLMYLKGETALLNPQAPVEFRGPLVAKYRMYLCFLGLVFVSMAMEVYCNALVGDDGRMWVVLLAYEISNVAIMGTLGIVFRPCEYSPYFFMVSTRRFDPRSMPITVLEADEHAEVESNVVEMAPLLRDRTVAADEDVPTNLVFIKYPDNSVALGARI